MFEFLDTVHIGLWTTYLFLWAMIVASGIACEIESRRADDFNELRQVAFRYRDMIRYEQCIDIECYHRTLCKRWDIVFYSAALLNIGIGHMLGIFPWQ